ncbi:hypothetical protein NDU88_006453 [Pleurodeles waltl]|uniref:Uncharacterized protein n=1 Tax=Pleurodeles waltl TaxID=8319 RepID=A0AAV7QIS2_PLEWA|nr:hypothetical protein NDU88_006453 [Pleurodeles waltl]
MRRQCRPLTTPLLPSTFGVASARFSPALPPIRSLPVLQEGSCYQPGEERAQFSAALWRPYTGGDPPDVPIITGTHPPGRSSLRILEVRDIFVPLNPQGAATIGQVGIKPSPPPCGGAPTREALWPV